MPNGTVGYRWAWNNLAENLEKILYSTVTDLARFRG